MKLLMNLILILIPLTSSADTLTCYKNLKGDYVEYPVLLGKGHDNSNDLDWGRGGGCILKPLQDIWNATQKNEFMFWDGVTSIDVQAEDNIPIGIARFFNVLYLVDNSWPLPDVKWNMDWLHQITRGTANAPEQITITFNKTSGTTHIKNWQGYIVLDQITPNVVSFESLNQVKATQTDADDAANGVIDLYNKAKNL